MLERVDRSIASLSGGDPLVAAEAEVPAEPIHVNGRAICPRPFPARIDNHVFADAYNTGAGAVVSVEGQEAAASSNVLALRQMAPPGMSAVMDRPE